MKKTTEEKVISVSEVRYAEAKIPIIGITLLCQNNVNNTKIDVLLRKQMGEKIEKEKRDPRRDWEESFYTLPKKPGKYFHPGRAFMSCLSSAAHKDDGISKIEIKKHLRVVDEWVEIIGKPMPYNEKFSRDAVRNSSGVIDFRWRGKFPPGWRAILTISYNKNKFARFEDIVNFINKAGFQVGIGENRPYVEGAKGSRSVGTWGTFKVDAKEKK